MDAFSVHATISKVVQNSKKGNYMAQNQTIKLQNKCPCKLSDCPVYRQMPTRVKATDYKVFFVQQTVNDRFKLDPRYAVLGLFNPNTDKEKIRDTIEQMVTVCDECRKDKEPKMPSCITLNLRPLSSDVFTYCANTLNNHGK